MKRLALLFVLCVSPALAHGSVVSGLSLGAGVSLTGGFNVFVGYHNPSSESFLFRYFGLRIDGASTGALRSAIDSAIDSYMRDGRDVGDGVRIDNGSLDVWHGSVLLDYYPFGRNWRLTSGLVRGGAKLDADIFGEIESAPSQRFYFYLAGDHYYYNGNQFGGTAHIDWDYYGPYFGTGLEFGLGCAFGVFVDIGVVLTNRPAKLSLDIPHDQLYIYNTQTATWSPVTIPQLDIDVGRATADANRKLSDFRVYPMVKVGFLYRF